MNSIKRTFKKGFTLVELVVVIAIIAVLSAVSVVTYFGLTNKANRSADEQAVAQMNQILKADAIENGKPESVAEVIDVLQINGYADNFDTYYSKYELGWHVTENVIVLTEGKKVVYPKAYVADSFTTTEILPLHEFVTSVDGVQDILDKGIVGDTITLAGEVKFDKELVIDRDVTIVGFGKTVVSEKPITVKAESNVTFKMIHFENPVNARDNASSIYVKGNVGDITFDSCTFGDAQYESIQIVPTRESVSNINIKNCVFDVSENHKQVRYIHIEGRITDDSGTAKWVNTENVFLNIEGCIFNDFDACTDDAITIMGVPYANQTYSGNTINMLPGSTKMPQREIWIGLAVNPPSTSFTALTIDDAFIARFTKK